MEPQGNAEGTTGADRLAARLVEGLPVTTGRLDLAGVSTSLLEGGEGPPMVVLHGQGGFAEIMGGLIANLVDRYRVIAPDLPGLGRSVIQDGTLEVPGVMRWLRELIAKTCDQPPILLGVSMAAASRPASRSSEGTRSASSSWWTPARSDRSGHHPRCCSLSYG